MPGFNYKFLEKLKRRFQCPLCRRAMQEPVQVSTCGHRFCDTCLQEFLSEGVFQCPEDHLPLDNAKIYPDTELEEQILSLTIRCIHSEEGCRWMGQVKQLQSHFSTCAFNVIACPNRCGTKLSRRDLAEHLQHTCTKRQVLCDHCGCSFSGEGYQDHQGACPQESVYCENKCGTRMMRRLMSQHATSECPKRTLPCEHCGKDFLWDTLQSHQLQCPRLPIPCPQQCGAAAVAREDLPAHLHNHCSGTMVLCPFKEAGCQHRGPKLAMGLHLDSSVLAHLSLTCGLLSRQRREVEALRRRVEELSVQRVGPLLWRISEYTRRRRSAAECLSPAFYSHRHGYRLQASAFLDGNGSGEGVCMSLYIRVLPGEFDTLLEWPFPGRITFSLLDQSDPVLSKPQHLTETFSPDPMWKNFQRPRAGSLAGSVMGSLAGSVAGAARGTVDESMLGFGYPKFISHEEIRKRNYIRHDAIFIKASVDIPDKIMA